VLAEGVEEEVRHMAKRILIADDNKIVRRALRVLLTKHVDVEVRAEADDGRKAIEAALSLRPDLAILDVHMPELNGIEVATILKRRLPDSKTILFTMYSSQVGKGLASAAGVNVILPKEVGVSSFIETVGSLLQ
jgi:DNA-binding NarL/FixJ family response regulator